MQNVWEKSRKKDMIILQKLNTWNYARRSGLVGKAKWYNHTSARAVQNERVKILWDINIQANHVIQYKRSDIDVM